MYRDFGSGLTVDELIGMLAFHICNLNLPPGEIFLRVKSAAKVMIMANLESFVLTEIWEDGYTVWQSMKDETPALVTPGGQLIRTSQNPKSD